VPKVSVIVPVYNPGPNIDDLIRTVLDQSMPAEDYEVVFVDDGSTDDTPARLDALAAEHDNVRTIHIPNSGWPGKPRNVGTDAATGEYVLYVDNDDWLGHEALERWYAKAKADDADVVVGKVVGHGKFVPRPLFRRNRSRVTLEWPPLITLLSPHKLFRRAFLTEHGIRFPEGRRRLEDHVFVMHAFFHAESISVLADYPCYHWMLRDASASFARMDPHGYFANLREVLDLIEEHTEPGPLRDELFVHWYRGKLLKRVGGGAFSRREKTDPEYNRELYEVIHELAHERFDARHEALLPFHLRVRSRLLRDGDFEGLKLLADFEGQLKARGRVRVTPRDGLLDLDVEATIDGAEQRLAFRRDGDRIRWLAPPELERRLPAEALDATERFDRSTLQLLLQSKADKAEFLVPGDADLRLDRKGRALLTVRTTLDPASAAGGGPLPAGDWALLGNPIVGGFTRTASLRRDPGKRALKLTVDAEGRIADTTAPTPAPAPQTPSVRLKRRVKRLLRR
jgi:glycosyltransferase involved in cell wall biosynthesis